MRKALLFSFAGMFLLSSSLAVRSQCGADGLSPCIVPISASAAVKTAVKKAGTLKKIAASEVEKIAPKPVKPNKQTKPVKPKTDIYDSLKIDPKTAAKTGAPNELFPVNGVTLGVTTERQMQILGGARSIYTDEQTGERKIYYTIEKRSYWLRNGVADSVGFFMVSGMPTKWRLLGFSFALSMSEAVALLKSLGYEVEMYVSLPKFEDIGKVTTYPGRVVGTKTGAVPIVVGMEFTLGSGKTLKTPNTMYYFAVRVKP